MHCLRRLALTSALALAACQAPSVGEAPEGQAAAVEQNEEPTTCKGGQSPISIVATAPVGMGSQHLGRPLGAKFETISGEEGASLFPDAKKRTTTLNTIEHKVTSIDDSRGLSASVSGWGVFSAEAKNATQTRYASYRASQLERAEELDDATEMRTPPAGAVYYAARIIYGHSFEMVFSGDAKSFNAGVKAKLFGFGGSASGFASQNSLTATAVGRGMQPTDGNAIFASSAEEIQKAYQATGDAVPILVEYRSIPSACLPDASPVQWLAPAKYTLSFEKVDVYRDSGGEWSVDAACSVNGQNIEIPNRVVWDRQGGLNDDCQRGEPGPQNDGDYCTANMFWTTDIDAAEGDTIKCSVSGTAWGKKKPIAPAELTYVAGKEKVSAKFGNGNGSTEYWLHYSITPAP